MSIKAVILAGGLGTRLAEETFLRPKPMVQIGDKPILWHIMKIYSVHGVNEFVICCGSLGYVIKEYFSNYSLHTSDVTLHMDEGNRLEVHQRHTEPWKVTLVDTGDHSYTGGRLGRVRSCLNNSSFCLTYGDVVADVNVGALIAHHQQEGKQATLTAVQPPGRYGALDLDGNEVLQFKEKADGENTWINGGFFVVEPSVLDLIEGDGCSWEGDVLPQLAAAGQLSAYRHPGFWQPMDTPRDRSQLEELWASGQAPWQLW